MISSTSFSPCRPSISAPNFLRRPSAARRALVVSSAAAAPPQPRLASSPYEVLGLSAAATGQEIKAAYRRLARTCHPDVSRDLSAEAFLRLREAYATLSDPQARAEYDRIAVPVRVPRRGSGGAFYTTRRSWETDQCW